MASKTTVNFSTNFFTKKGCFLYVPFTFYTLKVFTNEKRGGLEVAFDRSPLKLFTLRFSNKSVQAPSCERPKTNLANSVSVI
jgi:hypothetical protein